MISNTPPVVLENIEKKIDHNELEQKKVTFAPGTDCSEKLNKPVIRRGKKLIETNVRHFSSLPSKQK